MSNEQLEFLISQYLDGMLPDAERSALERRLGDDPEARALLDEYRSIDQTVGTCATPLPQLRWDVVAEKISQALVRTDADERLLAEYSNRTLDPERMAEANAVVSLDPESAIVVSEYRRLDELLGSEMPLPPMDWDLLATRISDTVKAERAEQRRRMSIGWAAPLGWTAAAAGLLLAAGLGIRVYLSSPVPEPMHTPPAAMGQIEVTAFPSDHPEGPGFTSVRIGPSSAVAASAAANPYALGSPAARPSNVEIAGAITDLAKKPTAPKPAISEMTDAPENP